MARPFRFFFFPVLQCAVIGGVIALGLFAPSVTRALSLRGQLAQESLQLWGPTLERFYNLPVGTDILLTGASSELNPVLTNFKTDQLNCRSVPISYGGSDNNNAKWLCTALATGNSNSEVYFMIGDQRSNTIVIQVQARASSSSRQGSSVPQESLQLWGPTTERFFLLPVGQSLLLTGADSSLSPVLTNFKTDQLNCRSVPISYGGSDNNNAKWLCTALATGNSNSEVFFTIGDQRSNTIVIQVQARASSSSRQGSNNIPSPGSTIPSAGYEDEVLTNIETYPNPFPDTDMKRFGGKAAAELYRRGVLGGFPDGQFKGDRSVNRAEAAKFLLLARFGTVADAPNSGQFSDVLDGQWYTKFVVTAAQKAIIKGYPDGTFRPANQVNKAEFLKMLALTFDLPLNLPHSFDDASSSDWFAPYLGIEQKYIFFYDEKGNQFHPQKALSREEVAMAIYKYLRDR